MEIYNNRRKSRKLFFILVLLPVMPILLEANFNRDSSGVIADSTTGLAWQDDYSNNEGKIKIANWKDSLTYCEELNLGGKDDWRLPNIRELQSIVDYIKYNPSINSIFKNIVSDYYWSSSSSNSESSNYSWSVNFNFGYDDWSYKNDKHNVRCVRGGE